MTHPFNRSYKNNVLLRQARKGLDPISDTNQSNAKHQRNQPRPPSTPLTLVTPQLSPCKVYSPEEIAQLNTERKTGGAS